MRKVLGIIWPTISVGLLVSGCNGIQNNIGAPDSNASLCEIVERPFASLGQQQGTEYEGDSSVYEFAAEQYQQSLILLQDSESAEDSAAAISTLERLVACNYGPAHYTLGAVYSDGRLVELDHALAATYFQSAAEHGSFEAMFALGWMHEHGQGFRVDTETAFMWYVLSQDGPERLGVDRTNALTQIMSESEVREAQYRAEICRTSWYLDC
ncbi:tetratricopeptide repeat protein [Hyphobacterium sp.]|uniref:tetratricopeptide repeat protein n=1 Tax=Hyphobacterium sp. TaxID=2004662 RepID=UPI003747ADB2